MFCVKVLHLPPPPRPPVYTQTPASSPTLGVPHTDICRSPGAQSLEGWSSQRRVELAPGEGLGRGTLRPGEG